MAASCCTVPIGFVKTPAGLVGHETVLAAPLGSIESLFETQPGELTVAEL